MIWLAGFIDGEGCINADKRAPNSRYRLLIAQSHEEGGRVVKEIRDTLGFGGIHHRKRISKDKVVEDWDFRLFRRKDLLQLLPTIIPFLRIKRKEAEDALKYLQTHPLDKMHANTRSWSVEEIAYLRRDYPTYGGVRISDVLKRTPDAIRHKAFQLGIKVA